jgi:hypothetical protein
LRSSNKLVWKTRVSLEVADVKAAMAKVSEGLARPMLVEMTDIETVSHDARAAFAIPCAASRIALLGSNAVDWMIANFRGAHTYPCPTQFFTDRTEAMNWLLQDPLP